MNKITKPDHIVAEEAVNQLIKQRLLSEDKKEEWIKKLSKEGVFSEDWNLLADFYIKNKVKIDEQR